MQGEMVDFLLEIEASATFGSTGPTLEIILDGVVVSADLITAQTGSGTTSLSYTLSYSGAYPSSLHFRFADGSGEPGSVLTLDSVSINGVGVLTKAVNNKGNIKRKTPDDDMINGQSTGLDIKDSAVIDAFDTPMPPIVSSSWDPEAGPTLGDFNPVTITGTAGDDDLSGVLFNNDVINAMGGDDIVHGEQGNDQIAGGTGNDVIYGNEGNDVIIGEDGNDSIEGQVGDDQIYGNLGNDKLYGNEGNDIVSGNEGNDIVSGGQGADTLYGGDGNDRLYGNEDNDTVYGGAGNDKIFGGTGNNTLNGGDDHDLIWGGTGNDIIYGDAGNDRIRGGGGNDQLHGGDGNDNVKGSTGIDTLYGDNGDDVLAGYAGNDTLWGGNGADKMYSHEGNDFVYGEAGDDFIKAKEGDDFVDGGADNDVIRGGEGSDTLNGGTGDDIIYANKDASMGGQGLSSQILANSPVAYWRLDETSGGTAINYGSGGSAINGTYQGGVSLGNAPLYGTGGTSANFDGANDRIAIPDSALINTSAYAQRTVELVFNADTTAGRQVIYEEGATVNGLTIYIDNGTLYISGEDDGDWVDANINSSINAGQTYHVAFVFDQPTDSFTGYLDGVNIGSVTVNNTIFPSHSGNIGIGRMDDGAQFHDGEASGNGFYFDGSITDVAVYNTALSAAELLNHATAVGSSVDPDFDDGDDILNGGAGNDTLYASGGADELYGDAGNDTLHGSGTEDLLYGGNDSDTLYADGVQITAPPPPTSFSTLSSIILADNPDAYWALNETSGGTADNQGSLGAAVDGVIQNGVTLGSTGLYTGSDTSFDFDGTNDRIQIPDNAAINTSSVTQRTIELVFNADSTAGQQVLYEEGGTVNAIAIYIESGSIYFEARDSGEWGPFNISTAINAGQTYHAAIVLDTTGAGTFTGYLDGAVVGSGITTTDLDAHGGDIGIGWSDGGAYYHDGADGTSGHYFNGRMSDIALYNTALTAGDIQERSDAVQGILPAVPGIDDRLYGGDGLDTLYGGEGRDAFIFEAASAFNNVDIINDFNYYEYDALDLTDILTGYVDGVSDINDFVQVTTVGANSVVSVDANGTVGGSTFTDIAQINNFTGIDADTLLNNSSIIPV